MRPLTHEIKLQSVRLTFDETKLVPAKAKLELPCQDSMKACHVGAFSEKFIDVRHTIAEKLGDLDP